MRISVDVKTMIFIEESSPPGLTLDLCSTCSAFKHKPDKTDSDKEEHADHLKRKEHARDLKQKAKEKAKNGKDSCSCI